MAEIKVQSSQAIQKIVESLSTERDNFFKEAQLVVEDLQNLTTKWEGDASDAFQAHWRKEADNFNNFLRVIDEYIAKLVIIKGNYEQAEMENIAIAEG